MICGTRTDTCKLPYKVDFSAQRRILMVTLNQSVAGKANAQRDRSKRRP